eukprot:scaffold16043_cov115-Isochrysis_galbana.AAC.7
MATVEPGGTSQFHGDSQSSASPGRTHTGTSPSRRRLARPFASPCRCGREPTPEALSSARNAGREASSGTSSAASVPRPADSRAGASASSRSALNSAASRSSAADAIEMRTLRPRERERRGGAAVRAWRRCGSDC